jgi:hypothetical protein
LDERENGTIEDEISQIGENDDMQHTDESETKLHEIISLSDLSDD